MEVFVVRAWNNSGVFVRKILKMVKWLKGDEKEDLLLAFKYYPKLDILVVKPVKVEFPSEEEIKKEIREG